MSTYTADALVALVRLTLWFTILFVWLPRRLFPAAPTRPWTRFLCDYLVRMSFATILIVHVLAFLHLYDLVSLVTSYGLMHLGYLTWVRRIPVRETARRAWREVATFLLDVLEMRVQVRRWLHTHLRATRQRLVASLPHGMDRWWAGAFGIVLGVSGYLRLQDAFRHPAPAPWDYYLHLLWLKGLGINRLYVDGVYPYGSHALFEVLRRFTALDAALMLRLLPGLTGVLLVTTIYWSVVRLTNHRGPALIAAALYGIFAYAGWLPLRLDLQGDVLAVDVALVFLLPTFVFLTEALQPRLRASRPASSRTRWLLFQGTASLFLIHPFVGLWALVGTAGAALATVALDRREGVGRAVARVFAATLGGALLGTLPLWIGLAMGKPLHQGPLRWDVNFLGTALREPWFPPAVPSPGATPLLTLAVAGALVLLLLPDAASYAFSPFLLLLALFFQPERFGLPEWLLPVQVARVLAPVLCVVIGLALHRAWAFLTRTLRHRMTRLSLRGARGLWPAGNPHRTWGELSTTVLGLTAMLLVAPPLNVPALPRREYDAATLQLYRIKREFPNYKWTVVSFPEALPQVYGRGFFIENEVFLKRYRPETWRFDPRRPELAVPTPHVFIFIERQPFIAPGMTATEAARRDAVAQRLRAWVQRYRTLHGDISLYYQDRVLAVYHIYRPPEVEERILEQIERQERERRPRQR